MNRLHIGTQGWNYDAWLGGFYPSGTRAADYLPKYVKAFDTVEIDSSFYAVPSAASIVKWRKSAPAGFRYALKVPQAVTHEARLVDCTEVMKQFCERVRGLDAALGTLLIQCPPDLSPRVMSALEKFLVGLPRDLRFAIEFRDRHWLLNENGEVTLELLRTNGVALALTDSQWIPRELIFELMQHPAVKDAAFAYVRWLGPRSLTDYSRVQLNRDDELAAWAEALTTLRQAVPLIDGYFNNHFQGHSPASANHLKRLLAMPVIEPAELIEQPSLF